MIGTIGEGLYELGVDEGAVNGEPRQGYGGDAANTAVMAARLGGGARFCGRIGNDALGKLLLEFWRRSGVDTRSVVTDDAPTGIYVNERLADGGCRFHYHRRGSAGSRLSSEESPTASWTASTRSTSPGSRSRSRRPRPRRHGSRRGVRASGARSCPSRSTIGRRCSRTPASSRRLHTARTSSSSPRRSPSSSSAPDAEHAAQEVVLTLGADGAAAFVAGEEIRVAAPPVESVDASGAGDALAGVYLAERVAGVPAERALTRAVAAATLSCRSFGAALSYPDAADLDTPVAS